MFLLCFIGFALASLFCFHIVALACICFGLACGMFDRCVPLSVFAYLTPTKPTHIVQLHCSIESLSGSRVSCLFVVVFSSSVVLLGLGILCQVWDLAAYASCCVPASVFPLMWFEWLYVCWCIVAAARRHGQIRRFVGLTAQQGRLQIQGCRALQGKTRQVCRQQRE